MARKSRYANYYKGALAVKNKKAKSTKSSILGRLKELKGQEFVVNVPIEEMMQNKPFHLIRLRLYGRSLFTVRLL